MSFYVNILDLRIWHWPAQFALESSELKMDWKGRSILGLLRLSNLQAQRFEIRIEEKQKAYVKDHNEVMNEVKQK